MVNKNALPQVTTRDFTSFQEALDDHKRHNSAMERLLAEASRLGIKPDEQPRVQCETCCDKGVVSYIVPQDDPRFGKLFPCPNPACPTNNAKVREHQARLLERAKIPPKYAGFTFETWEDAARHRSLDDNMAVDWARAWVEAPGHFITMPGAYIGGGSDASRNGLIFAGQYGTGKTGLMIAMAHAVLERGEAALYIRAADYFDVKYRTYQSYGDDGRTLRDNDRAAVDAVLKAPVLFLDDFNISNGTANKQDVIEELVRYRHGHELPTVLTCNEPIGGLERLWGRRAIDALLEACHWIPVSGAPLRDTRQIGGAK